MSDKFEMVVVNGVRYRPEDAPKQAPVEAAAEVEKKSISRPANKSRTVTDK